NSPDEICKFLGADSLGYVSLPALRQAVADTEGKFCTSCYTGVYPTDLVQLEVRESNGNPEDAKNGSAHDSVISERVVAVEHEG
ncbi:MAG: hypothetical protein WA798_07635, partial [Candidatus Acidiferrum sp.]